MEIRYSAQPYKEIKGGEDVFKRASRLSTIAHDAERKPKRKDIDSFLSQIHSRRLKDNRELDDSIRILHQFIQASSDSVLSQITEASSAKLKLATKNSNVRRAAEAMAMLADRIVSFLSIDPALQSKKVRWNKFLSASTGRKPSLEFIEEISNSVKREGTGILWAQGFLCKYTSDYMGSFPSPFIRPISSMLDFILSGKMEVS